MSDFFICPICENKETKYIGYREGKPYCRKCIEFNGRNVLEVCNKPMSGKVFTSYSLTEDQDIISQEIVKNIAGNNNVLVHAVTGAGKTEITFNVISKFLNEGKIVAFAVPRKDIVIELYQRLSSVFRMAQVVSLYGGNTERMVGNLIILTTHQLYRYLNYFDLVVLDEIDAFPFKNNEVLNTFLKKSNKGNFIYMTATLSDEEKEIYLNKKFKLLTLYKRFHGMPLPVPTIQIGYGVFKYILLLSKTRKFYKELKPFLVFVPKIVECKNIYMFLKLFIKDGNCVFSSKKDRENIIKDFKNGKLKYLVTTSVLERGVTIDNLQVIIFNASHELYTRESLIQIAGRVGRKTSHPNGEVIYISSKKTIEMTNSIEEISRINGSN